MLNIPPGSNVSWYWDSRPDFTPPLEGTRFGGGQARGAVPGCPDCPELEMILVNSCGDEIHDELIVISSGTGFFARNVELRYGPDADESELFDLDITGSGIGCSVQCGDISLISGCDRVCAACPGDLIPSDALVVLFTSADAASTYDFSAICNDGLPIYVLSSNCARTIEAFPNQVANDKIRTVFELNEFICPCPTIIEYASADISGANGDYITLQDGFNDGNCRFNQLDINQVGDDKSFQSSASLRFNADFCGIDSVYVKAYFDAPASCFCPETSSEAMLYQIICPETPLNYNLEISTPECDDGSPAQIVLQINQGISPYTVFVDEVFITTTSENTVSLENILPGFHSLLVLDENGCGAPERFAVPQPRSPEISAGLDTSIILGNTYSVEAQVSLDTFSVRWSPTQNISCDACLTPTFSPMQSTEYVLEIMDTSGCSFYDTLSIIVINVADIKSPSVFTPNDDGLNDYFYLIGDQTVGSVESLRVFNRLGSQVYHGRNLSLSNPTEGWNGRLENVLQNPGVYLWTADIRLSNNEIYRVSGDITLLY